MQRKATVSSAGLVTGISTGSTTITATSGGIRGTAALTIITIISQEMTESDIFRQIPLGVTVGNPVSWLWDRAPYPHLPDGGHLDTTGLRHGWGTSMALPGREPVRGCGSSGLIVTSPTGSFGYHMPPGLWGLYGVTWSGTQFVAVGSSGLIVTSPDGVAWTPQASSTTDDLLAVTWSGTQFVAVGGFAGQMGLQGGAVSSTSPDGVTWTARTPGAQGPFPSVVWSGAQFVAVGKVWLLARRMAASLSPPPTV